MIYKPKTTALIPIGIVNAETSGPQLRNSYPYGNWKPKPNKRKKPKEISETKTDNATNKDSIDSLMSHKSPKQYTPGEIT